ncbi:uncharacterized protein LOC121370610 [Gigantopelta aegis]|uniref:uncharacterized protein LOC121370610 n=1 Tax=Gigantopelta aegis TaxID=1735272 RepID=UPI001B88B12B|nr:uncharacterized protein LOC121370610 [Gigantopelta aegis]
MEIKKLCNFRYITQPEPSQLIKIDESSVLVYRIPLLSLKCPCTQSIIEGCTFCIIAIPSYCALSTEELVYPAPFGSCVNQSTHVTLLHPVNLALLQHFFNASALSSIAGDTTFTKAISIDIPDFHIYSHNFSSMLAQDKQDHLSLKRMVQSAKQDRTIFKTLAEPLLDGQINLTPTWPDTNDITTIVSSAFSIISILLVIWMFFKVRTMCAALLLITTTVPCKAMELPSFHYQAATTPQTDSFVLTDLTDYHISVMLGIISILMITLIIILIIKQRQSHQHCIMVEITSGPLCITIPIMPLTLCPSYWLIKPPNYINNLQILGYLFPTLGVNWPGFLITNKLTHKSFALPSQIRIFFFTARKLRNLFQQPVTAYILLLHHGLF